MIEVAPDVFLLRGSPQYMINTYLIGDVLIDAGIKLAANRLLKQLKGRKVSAHALTHGHPDHQGSSKTICATLGIPLWCSEVEVKAVESGDMTHQIPRNALTRFMDVVWTGPGAPVDRALHEGDEVGGFTVLEVPGHSPGHLAYWRESDGVLILGDVATNMSFVTTLEGLYEPPGAFTLDREQNLASMRKLAALNPKVICFGHGKPLRDGGKFRQFVSEVAG